LHALAGSMGYNRPGAIPSLHWSSGTGCVGNDARDYYFPPNSLIEALPCRCILFFEHRLSFLLADFGEHTAIRPVREAKVAPICSIGDIYARMSRRANGQPVRHLAPGRPSLRIKSPGKYRPENSRTTLFPLLQCLATFKAAWRLGCRSATIAPGTSE